VAGPGFSGSYRFFRRLAVYHLAAAALKRWPGNAQASILFFSCLSIWALSRRYRLGFAAGLCGQPLLDLYRLGQRSMGVFLVSIWFTGKPYPGTFGGTFNESRLFPGRGMVGGMAA